jgi:hypothetical protein
LPGLDHAWWTSERERESESERERERERAREGGKGKEKGGQGGKGKEKGGTRGGTYADRGAAKISEVQNKQRRDTKQ